MRISYIWLLLLLSIGACKQSKDVNPRFADNPPLEDFVLDEGLEDQIRDNCVKYLFIHATASRDGVCWTEADFNENWKQRGFTRPGYDMAINPRPQCSIVKQGVFSCTRSRETAVWGVSGRDEDGDKYNYVSLHLAWVGGFNGKDERTLYQKRFLHGMAQAIKDICPNVIVRGHNEVAAKSCPNFDVSEEFRYLNH